MIAFGQIRIVQDPACVQRAIQQLACKYAPADSPEHRQQAIDRELAALCILEMEIEHITGKEAIELVGRSAPVPGPLPPRKKE